MQAAGGKHAMQEGNTAFLHSTSIHLFCSISSSLTATSLAALGCIAGQSLKRRHR